MIKQPLRKLRSLCVRLPRMVRKKLQRCELIPLYAPISELVAVRDLPCFNAQTAITLLERNSPAAPKTIECNARRNQNKFAIFTFQ